MRRKPLVTSILATLVSTVAAGWAPESPAAEPHGAFYIHAGEARPLELEPSKLAIRFRESAPTERRRTAMEAHGLPALAARELPVDRWVELDLAMPMAGPPDAHAQLSHALGSPEVLFASPVFRTDLGGTAIVTPGVLLRFEESFRGDPEAFLRSRAPSLRIEEASFGGMPRAYRLWSASRNGLEVLELANRLATDPDVKWAEPDMLFSGRGPDLSTASDAERSRGLRGQIPNDPMFPQQWSLDNDGSGSFWEDNLDLRSLQAWDSSRGAAVTVAILDTGIDYSHPDLAPNLFPGYDATIGGGDGSAQIPCDVTATLSAGVIAAAVDNAEGIAGVAPEASIVSIRIGVSNGPVCDGTFLSSSSWYVDGLLEIRRIEAEIAATNWLDFQSSAIDDALAAARDNGVLIVAGTGDVGFELNVYPASEPSVFAFGAFDPTGFLPGFSSYGLNILGSAPGTDIVTTDRPGAAGLSPGDYATINSTGLAAANAAGSMAIWKSLNPQAGPLRFEDIFPIVADPHPNFGPGWNPDYGHGRVRSNTLATEPTSMAWLYSASSGYGTSDAALDQDGSDVVAVGSINASDPVQIVEINRQTGEFALISKDAGGNPANGDCSEPDSGIDSTYCVYTTHATNLTNATDANGTSDIVFTFRPAGGPPQNFLVSATPAGTSAGNGASSNPDLSPATAVTVYESHASDLIPTDANGFRDCFSTLPGTPATRVSEGPAGQEFNGASYDPAVSWNGSWTVFTTDATNAVTTYTNGLPDVLIKDMFTGALEAVNVAAGGGEPTGACYAPDVDRTGAKATFLCDSDDVAPGDSNGQTDCLLRDLILESTEVVSLDEASQQFQDWTCTECELDDDGEHVAFVMEQVVPQSSRSAGVTRRVYHRNLVTGVTTLVSRKSIDEPATGEDVAISGDGQHVAYESDDDITPNDGDGVRNVFVFSEGDCTPPALTSQPQDVTADLDDAISFTLTATGTGEVFEWRKNGVLIPGAVGTTYTIGSVQPGDAGTYDCTVKNYCGSVASSPATLAVNGATGIESTSLMTGPVALSLERPRPSPFSERTSVGFALTRSGSVRMTAHDVAGRRVATLVEGAWDAGHHSVVWDGRDDAGRPIAAGVYFLRLEAEGTARTRKVVRLVTGARPAIRPAR